MQEKDENHGKNKHFTTIATEKHNSVKLQNKENYLFFFFKNWREKEMGFAVMVECGETTKSALVLLLLLPCNKKR